MCRTGFISLILKLSNSIFTKLSLNQKSTKTVYLHELLNKFNIKLLLFMIELKGSSLYSTLIITQISDPQYASPHAESLLFPFPSISGS